MRRGSFVKVASVAGAFCVAIGVATAGATTQTASEAAPQGVCGASACEVVLTCGSAIQKTAPDAQGRFTFREVPAGTCTVSVAEKVASPRDAASGMATGKRQHKPVVWQVVVDELVSVRTSPADPASSTVSVVLQESKKEFKGHVTLMK